MEVLIAEVPRLSMVDLRSQLPSSFLWDHQHLELTASSRSSRSVSCPSTSVINHG